MKKDGIGPWVGAVGLAILGAVLMQRHVNDSTRRLKQSMEREPIWVLQASQAIERGDVLNPSGLKYRRVAKDEQPWSSITFDDPESSPQAERAYADLAASLSAHRVNRDIEADDFVLWTDLEQEQVSSLSDALKENTRAVAVLVDRGAVLSGLLQPNDRVDVLATYGAGIQVGGTTARGRSRAETIDKTRVVLENVTVLAVGNQLARGTNPVNLGHTGSVRVVLALDPYKALCLTYVQKDARISLLLRPRDAEAAGGYVKREVSSDDIEELVTSLQVAGGTGAANAKTEREAR